MADEVQQVVRMLGRHRAHGRPDVRDLERQRDELLAALHLLVDSCGSTDSYCETCGRHAPKNDFGHVTGPVTHVHGCAENQARQAIASVEDSP